MVNGGWGSCETPLMDGKTCGNRAKGNLGQESSAMSQRVPRYELHRAKPSLQLAVCQDFLTNGYHYSSTWLQDVRWMGFRSQNYEKLPATLTWPTPTTMLVCSCPHLNALKLESFSNDCTHKTRKLRKHIFQFPNA